MPEPQVYPQNYQNIPQFGPGNGGYEDYNPNSGVRNSYFKRVNILEIIVLVISLLALSGVFWWGLGSQNAINRDKQRQQDITQVMLALNEFYINSSTIPSQRAYPKSVCSESLNEVDYEFTLRRHLTGQVTALDSHAYITDADYPKDRSGVYAKTFKDRKVQYRCTEKLNLPAGSTTDSNIYEEGWDSCNFNQALKYTNCYLYTSSNNGDTFRIGYYKESSKSFVVYRRFREEGLQIEV